jgi:cyclopropane fatty-acyl-phospholipid synthase-like methyltransferase
MKPHMPTPEAIGQFYDQFTPFYEIVWGESLHMGYWPDSSTEGSIAEGQVRLTELMVSKVRLREGQHLLDAGCGTGGPAIHLARAIGCRVTGISVSPKQIEKARQKAAQAKLDERLQFQVANAMAMPFADASFDAAWAFESLFHMSDPDQALREMHRCIKPGGQLIIANYTLTQPMTPNEDEFYRQVFHAGSLLTHQEHQKRVRAAGFELEETMDISANVVRTTPLTVEALNTRMPEIKQAVPGLPLDMLDTVWRRAIDISYRSIGYILLTAHKR